FRAAIVRPVSCNRRSLSSAAAFAAVRSVQDGPPVDKPAGPPPRQRPVLSPPPANQQSQGGAQFVRGAARCGRRGRQARSVGTRRRSTPRGRAAPPKTAKQRVDHAPFLGSLRRAA